MGSSDWYGSEASYTTRLRLDVAWLFHSHCNYAHSWCHTTHRSGGFKMGKERSCESCRGNALSRWHLRQDINLSSCEVYHLLHGQESGTKAPAPDRTPLPPLSFNETRTFLERHCYTACRHSDYFVRCTRAQPCTLSLGREKTCVPNPAAGSQAQGAKQPYRAFQCPSSVWH